LKITEYTPIELDHCYLLQLSDGIYYKGYDIRKGVETTDDENYASYIANEKFVLELIGFLKNFFDENGQLIPEKANMVIPPLVGLAEAAELLGWDKRKVSTYISRGSFPKPLKQLASGPIWTYKEIEDYKKTL
jgi:hypothetical protein